MQERKKGSLSAADQITATSENGSYKHSKNFLGIFFVIISQTVENLKDATKYDSSYTRFSMYI